MAGKTHRQAPRGKRTLLWMCGCFVALQLAGSFVVDYVLPQVRFPQAYRRFADLKSMPRSPEVVYLGSSRFQGLLNHSELTHELRDCTGRSDLCVFDGAVEGGDPIAMEFVFREILQRGVCPKLLVVEASPEFLNRHNGSYSLHVARQIKWGDIPDHWSGLIEGNAFQRLLLDRLLPLYRHRYHLLKQAGRAFAPLDGEYALAPRHGMSDTEVATLRAAFDRPLTPEHLERINHSGGLLKRYELGVSCRSLERILDLCREHDIRPLLVGAPVSSYFRAEYAGAIQNCYQEFLDRLQTRCPFRYVECRDALPDHLFVDSIHAKAPEGTIVFSRFLARQAIGPMLQADSHQVPGQVVGFKKN